MIHGDRPAKGRFKLTDFDEGDVARLLDAAQGMPAGNVMVLGCLICRGVASSIRKSENPTAVGLCKGLDPEMKITCWPY